MSMRVVFLKDHGDFKAGFEGFIPRPLGKAVCQQNVAIPWCMKDDNPENEKLKKSMKPKRKVTRKKKAIPKKVQMREKAIPESKSKQHLFGQEEETIRKPLT